MKSAYLRYRLLSPMSIMTRHKHRLIVTSTCLLSSVLLAQNRTTGWKEYSYPNEGFAVSLPDTPRIHPDRTLANATAYSVSLTPDFAFTIRAVRGRNCVAALQQLKAKALNSSDVLSRETMKDVSLQGHQGIDYEETVSDERVGHWRYICGDASTVYMLGVDREKSQPLMPAAVKIIDSFRLLRAKPSP